MRSLLLVLLGGSLLAASGRADASFARGWYGWQLALADAGALGLSLAPVDLSWRGATVATGMTALFINGAVVNMAHGNPVTASRSLLRLPAFLLGRLVGFGAGELFCKEAGCKAPLRTAGGAFGLGSVVILDLMDAFEPAPSWLPDLEPTGPTTPPGTRTSPLGTGDPPGRRPGAPPIGFTWPMVAGRF